MTDLSNMILPTTSSTTNSPRAFSTHENGHSQNKLPSPLYRQQPTPPVNQNHSPMFFNQTPDVFQMPHPTSASNDMDQQQTIVGPSDHYNVHHQYGNGSNGKLATNGSAKNNVINVNNNNDTNLGQYGVATGSNGKYDDSEYYKSSAKYQKQQQINNNFQNNEETKVCVIVDSRTPVIIKVARSPNQITLADLKRALPAIDQPNNKYFFKSNDSEFGIVKEEIQEDDGRLPTYRNRVVAWIVTPAKINDEMASKYKSESDTCNLTYSQTTSYDDGSSSIMTTDADATSYFTETDEDSLSCSNYSETTCDTFLSQRKNQQRYSRGAGNKSPMHHRYHESQPSSPYRLYSSGHRGLDRLGKDNISSRSSSSSTTSSASQSDATAVQCLTVHLVLTDENFLGLHIYANTVNGVDEGIYVDGVTADSAVALDGRIEPGDKLIQVNDVNLEELTNDEAVKVLKDAVIKRGPLKLVVAKFIETNKNDPNDGLGSLKETVHPIDTAAWVAHAQAITMPNGQEHANSTTSSPSFGSNAQDTDCIRPASTGLAQASSGLRLNRASTDLKEMIQHMKLPEVGINIRDREWLKIQIPEAFLGSDLIAWLERNVYGFTSERDAKKFASRMLKEGYIKDPISKKSFSSKSLYTFVL